MKEKLKGACPVALIIIIFLLIIGVLSSCEKKQTKSTCINALETFNEYSSDYSDFYYNKCKRISNTEEEIEQCIDELELTAKEIENFCDVYIELNEDYNDYKEY